MSILEIIKKDLTVARFEKNQKLVTILTTLYSEAASVGKTERNGESTDQEVLSVIKKFKEGVEQILSHKKDGDTFELVAEIDIYNKYLPQSLTTEELENIIHKIVNSSEVKNIGSIMNQLKSEYFGRYDGKTASTIIKSVLNT